MADFKFNIQMFAVKNGTSGNDVFQIADDYTSVYAEGGNDSIDVFCEINNLGRISTYPVYYSMFDGGAGNDTIDVRFGYGNTIYGGADDDVIYNRYRTSKNYFDVNRNYSGPATMDGGDGNDYLYNANKYSSMSGVQQPHM